MPNVYPDSQQSYPAGPCQDSFGRRWYAVHVHSKSERVAAGILSQKGYEEFLPLYRARRHWADRVKELELPLFPGYLFCRMNAGERLLPVLSTPGVLGIVSVGKVPVPVSDQEVESIRVVLRSGLPALPWPRLEPGDRVYVERGPLAGLEGVVLRQRKAYKFLISVPLLQRGVAAEIEREWVRPLTGHGFASAVPLR